MRVAYKLKYDDNDYEFKQVTKVDDYSTPGKIIGYKDNELLFVIERDLILHFRKIDDE